MAKESTPSKVKFWHFNMLKRFKEETAQSDEATSSKRSTPYRSVNFFDDPEMTAEPVMESGTADDGGRPIRVRRPPVRFGIDKFVS